MDADTDLGHLRWVLERQLHWIAAADVKAGGLVAAFMALAGIAATILDSTTPPLAGKHLFALAALLMVPGLGFAMSVFFPRTEANNTSLIYFREIAKHDSAAEYLKRVEVADASVVHLDLVNQIHVNAVIANCKHRHVRYSMVFGGFSIAVWLAAICVVVGAP